MERLGVGLIPMDVASVAEPSHVQRACVVKMRGLNGNTGDSALFTGGRSNQDSLLDSSMNLPAGIPSRPKTLGVRRAPSAALNTHPGSDLGIGSPLTFVLSPAIDLFAHYPALHGPATISVLIMKLIGAVIENPAIRSTSALWASGVRSPGLNSAVLVMIAPASPSQKAATAGAHDRLIRHRANSSVSFPRPFAAARGLSRAQIIPPSQSWHSAE
jgi:hypothetical protein